MPTFLDANAILRFLLNDLPEQAKLARMAVEDGAETTLEALAEVVYVLAGVYQVSRPAIAEALGLFLMQVEIDRRAEAEDALERYGESGLDFVDCVIIARAILTDQPVLTFDKQVRAALGA